MSIENSNTLKDRCERVAEKVEKELDKMIDSFSTVDTV